jgi:hypothetical protein
MITSKRGWILRRWQLQAPEILRSLEKRTPLLPNGTNIPVLSVPFSPDRKWFEIVMAIGAVARTLAKNIQEDDPEQQDFPVRFRARVL